MCNLSIIFEKKVNIYFILRLGNGFEFIVEFDHYFTGGEAIETSDHILWKCCQGSIAGEFWTR